MLGQDSFLLDIQGLIQSEVGTFLQLRYQLQEMSRSPVLTISDEANNLLITQTQLENDMPSAIEKSQSSEISDWISASGFFALMEKQVHDVGSLKNKYIGLGDSAKASMLSDIPILLLVGVGVFVIMKASKSKKKSGR